MYANIITGQLRRYWEGVVPQNIMHCVSFLDVLVEHGNIWESIQVSKYIGLVQGRKSIIKESIDIAVPIIMLFTARITYLWFIKETYTGHNAY